MWHVLSYSWWWYWHILILQKFFTILHHIWCSWETFFLENSQELGKSVPKFWESLDKDRLTLFLNFNSIIFPKNYHSPSSSPVVVAHTCSSVVLLRLAIRASLWLRVDVFGVSGLALAWLLLLVTHDVP